jgi:hypothetical protein
MRSNKAIATTLILIAVTSINSVAAADMPFATPDRNGDYASNYAPIQGKTAGRGDMASGCLWVELSS